MSCYGSVFCHLKCTIDALWICIAYAKQCPLCQNMEHGSLLKGWEFPAMLPYTLFLHHPFLHVVSSFNEKISICGLETRHKGDPVFLKSLSSVTKEMHETFYNLCTFKQLSILIEWQFTIIIDKNWLTCFGLWFTHGRPKKIIISCQLAWHCALVMLLSSKLVLRNTLPTSLWDQQVILFISRVS